MLRRTGARALLAPSGATDGLREAADAEGVVLLDGIPRGGSDAEGALARVRDLPKPDDVALILRTSGTTGTPKLVPATHRQLAARAEQAAETLGIGPGDRCLCPMPLCYGHGIYSGLLFSLLTGGSVILPERSDEESFIEALTTLRPTWYTAGPTHHEAIRGWLRRLGPRPAGHRLRFARCANASLPTETRDELEELLAAPVIETYGTSETGVIASERPSAPPRAGAMAAPDGVEVAILGEGGSPLEAGEAGAIAVRGPNVFSGYEGDAELNRRAFKRGLVPHRRRGVPRRRRVPDDRRPPGRGDQSRRREGLPRPRSSRRCWSTPRYARPWSSRSPIARSERTSRPRSGPRPGANRRPASSALT